jgi:hypothetical protein
MRTLIGLIRVASEAGPALYPANLFGSDDTEGTVRLITALLVLVPTRWRCC